MPGLRLNKVSKSGQYIIGAIAVIAVGAGCYALSPYFDYRVVALILLLVVSVNAMFFDIMPVLLTATLSALLWDFFFIPPKFTLTIGTAEDTLLLLMYFIVALVNATLTIKIRQAEKEAMQKKEKEKTVQLYGTLLNSLSHELRTPIAAILGATDNLQNNGANISAEDKNDLLGEISTATIRLNRQVENLLNMSRLESGFLKLNKDWCDINELVHDVVNRLRDNMRKHPVSIQVQENIPFFKLDYGIMEQVLHNLVYNAMVYTPDYCTITVRAFCKEEKLVLIVEDNGDGFQPQDIERVFAKFYRGERAKAGGIGLGLSIVKGFVEAHDGSITLENIDSGGARFTIIIKTEASYLNNLKNE